jgi:hypothetical protein
MRLIATLLMFAALAFTTARAEVTGAYGSTAAERADDCTKICEDDTLCVGWTYHAGACGLWASVPKQTPSAFTLSTRAPGFAHTMPVAAMAQPPTPAPRPQPQHEIAAVALLGGDNRSEDLRPRFGAGN